MVADRVCPIEEREERLRIESLVVHRAEGTGSLQEVGRGSALCGTDRLGKAETRGRGEQIAGRFVGQRAAHDPMSLCAEWQGVHRMLGAGGGLRVVERPLVKVEDGRRRVGSDPDPKLDGLGQDDFLFSRQQRHARDLAEVQARRILDVEGSVVRGRDVLDDRLKLDLIELASGGHDRIRRLGVIQLGVVRKLDQGFSACRRPRMAMRYRPLYIRVVGRPIRHGFGSRVRLRQRAGHTCWRVKS